MKKKLIALRCAIYPPRPSGTPPKEGNKSRLTLLQPLAHLMPQQRGYIAISMVLLLIVVAMAVATTVAFLSIGEGQSGLALEKGEGTLNLIEECADDLLMRMRNDGDFASTITSTTFTEPEGTCSLTKSGNTWTITNTSPTTYIRSTQVTLTRDGYGITFTPGTSASNWKEN